MAYDCDICECKGFKTIGGLASHKSTNRSCKLALAQKESEPVDLLPPFNVGESSSPSEVQQSADEFIHMIDDPQDYPSTPNIEEILCTPVSNFCRASDPKDRFDSTFHLVSFLRQCRNTLGMSVKDTRRFLGMLFHPKFNREDVSVKNVSDLLAYEEKMASDHGIEWKQVVVREKDQHVQELVLHFQDPVEVLSTLFSNPNNKKDFKLLPAESEATNHYSTPETGHWWKQMHTLVQQKCPGGVIAAIILYSDQTSLSNNQRVSGYPLMISLANIECAGRREELGHALLAILPTYGPCDHELLNSRTPTRLKCSLLHKCLSILLAPLKALSFTGLPLEDPWGSQKWVFPVLYGYIGDHPESCKVTCTFDSNRCSFPCSTCHCPRGQLSTVTARHEYRTQENMIALYEEMSGVSGTVAAMEELSKRSSVHPIQCALWGFLGGDTILGNPYRCVHPDKMHQFDLGLFKTLIGILKIMAVEVPPVTFKRKALQVLDQRLAWVSEHHRYPEFRLPSCKGRIGYFTSNATFQAFEHRSVFQVIIPLMLGVYQTPVLQVVVSMWDWYTLAFRKPVHTEETLAQMDQLMAVMVRKLIVVLGKYQKSEFDTVKVHAMAHLSDSIRRSGIPVEYSTNLYEHLHILLMKVPYRASNKKEYAKQMTDHHRRLLALSRKNATSILEADQADERFTALDKAVATGSNVLMGTRLRFHMDWLQRETTDIPLSGREVLIAQPEISLHLKTSLQGYCVTNDLQTIETLEVKTGVAIAAGVGDRFADWPMTGRATPSFHGAPYFSDVAIQMEEGGKEPLTSYAQLRLLFTCPVTTNNGDRATRNIALVRWYSCKTRAERTTGCLILKLVVDRTEIGGHSGNSYSRRRVSAYDVVEVANIIRVVHLVPHYGVDEQESGEFLLNRFKF